MKRFIRIALIVLAVVIVVLIVLPFVVPVNQFRPTIENEASAAIGRKVQLGNLSFSLLRGSVSAEDLSIADDPKFSSSPFLTAKALRVGVEIMPLIFSKTLNVTGITIDEPQVTLLKDAAGNWNYSTFGSSSKSGAKPVAEKTPASSSAPPNLTIKELELKDGKLIVGSTTSQKRTTYSIDVTARDVSMTSKFPVKVTGSGPGGGKLDLEGNVGPVDPNDSTLTPLDAKIKVSSMNLASTGFLDPSLGLGGLVDLDSTVTSQNGEAATKGSIKLSKALLVQGGSPAGVPANIDFNTRYDLRKSSGVLNPSTVKIGNATARVNGTYASKGESTLVDMKLVGDSMPAKDLQEFLPAIGVHIPQGANLTSGALTTNLNVKGPTDKLVTDGTILLANAKLAGFDLGSKMAAISALTGLKTGKDLEIEKMSTNVHMAPNGLRADNFNAVLPSLGTLIGGGTVDAKNNLDFKMAATLTGGAIGAASSAESGVGSLVGTALGGGKSGCKGGTTIPFMIQGTTADPKFVPDAGGLAAGMLKSQLGCAGSSVMNAPSGTQQSDPIGALGGLLKKKKP